MKNEHLERLDQIEGVEVERESDHVRTGWFKKEELVIEKVPIGLRITQG